MEALWSEMIMLFAISVKLTLALMRGVMNALTKHSNKP